MSSADLAIIGMTVVSLASIGRDYKIHMKVADRLRLVNPPKDQSSSPVPKNGTGTAQQPPDGERRLSALGGESKGEVA